MSLRRHPDKGLRRVIEEAEKKGWRVKPGKKYWKIYCPCGTCWKTIKCTPSDPNYETNLRAKLARDTCWSKQ